MKALAALPLLAIPAGSPPPVFEPLGVCSMNDSGASCWDFGGAPLPALTADVNRIGGLMDGFLTFVPGKKNRYVIVRQRPVRQTTITSGSGQVQSFQFVLAGVADLSALRVATLPGSSTETITAQVGVEEGEGNDMPLREGSKADVDGVRVEFGPVKPTESRGRYFSRGWGGPFWLGAVNWQFPYQVTPAGSVAFQAIGRDGKPIVFVDADGKPVERSKGEVLIKEVYGPNRDWTRRPSVEYAQINSSQGSGPLAWAYTNIDPKSIGKLRVHRVVEHTETIGPFALDPR